MIPLILRLKKSAHKEIAKAQDLIMTTLYEVFDTAVLHGGTAIWRCYRGLRFSEDIDVYLNKDLAKLAVFFERLQQKGFILLRKKISERSLYSTLRFQRTDVRFEALFKHAKGILKEYETAEGNYLTIYTLSAEELILEKIAAYSSRRKVRDLYDIFFLLRYVLDLPKVQKALQSFLTHFQIPPDEKELKLLILEGLVPTIDGMLAYIREKLAHGKSKI